MIGIKKVMGFVILMWYLVVSACLHNSITIWLPLLPTLPLLPGLSVATLATRVHILSVLPTSLANYVATELTTIWENVQW